MLDALLARLFKSTLDAAGSRAGGWFLAVAAFALALAAVPLIALHLYWIGFAVFVFSRLLSAVAAHAGAEYPAGPVLDVIAFAALPFAFALGDPVVSLQAVLMMFGLAVHAAAYLRFGRGWIGETELVIAFGLACFFPEKFGLVAYATSIVCAVSAGVQIGAQSSSKTGSS
jgi:hypothetical protein